jgi:hypothetical protein
MTPEIPSLFEGVRKFAWVFFPSFRRKPCTAWCTGRKSESSIFKPLRTVWTPVFTGVTTKRQFFHTFFVKGGPGPEPFWFRAGEISEIHCQHAHNFFSSQSIKKQIRGAERQSNL